MKTITRSKIHLAITTIILTATLVVPAAAQKLVPFKGALQGNGADGVLNFPVLPLHAEGFGFERYIHSVAFDDQRTGWIQPASRTRGADRGTHP